MAATDTHATIEELGLDTKTYWLTDWLTDWPSVAMWLWLWLERLLSRQLGEYKLVARQSPASKDVNAEAEEATALETATRRQPVKVQQTNKT
jgi:hypothetical protein